MPLQKSISVISYTVLNQFIQKLDARLDQQRKPSVNANIKRERVEGIVSNSTPPFSLPKWMINPAHQHLLSVDEIASGSAVSQVSVQADGIIGSPAGQVGVPVDDTGMQFPNIVEVSSVQDESSDFELPPDMRS